MHTINKIVTDQSIFSQIMAPIANKPKSLYFVGNLPEKHLPTVAIVGTRKPSAYGREVGYRLSYELAKRGVVIVSGLALGMDAIAHKGALDAGGITIAIMPGGLDKVYPATNHALAQRIVQNGGALISEYPVGEQVYPSNFIARNRIVAGLADGVLVVEAAIKSGTIHTAGFALDYGRPVMAVPAQITNPVGTGTNKLIATGARLVADVTDILDEIGVGQQATQTTLPLGETTEQTYIIKLLASGLRDAEEMQRRSGVEPPLFNQAMTMLEINGVIRPLGNNNWALT